MAILPRHRTERLPREDLLFEQILCAVDGSRGSAEAVRETLALAPCAARMRFIAVTALTETPGDPSRVASLAAHRARQALEAAQTMAGAHALAAGAELANAADVAAALIERAGDRTLLVVGSHGDSAHGATLAGSVARSIAARRAGPLLVARAGARADGSVPRILVAVDDTAGAAELVRVAGTIAAGCGGYVHLVHVQGRDYGSRTRHQLAELATELIERTGAEPVVDVACAANVAAHVCRLAQDSESSLIVAGRRRKRLSQIGEHIVDAAPCSVLVAPTA